MLFAIVLFSRLLAPSHAQLQTRAHYEVATLPRTPRELHSHYGEIFIHGNRNAASHRWSTYILDRAASMPESQLLTLFSAFCAVSGSPVYPSDYKRYRLHLAHAGAGRTAAAVTAGPDSTAVAVVNDSAGSETGFMYYCCWPCVCDTWDYIKVDTLTVTTAEGPKSYRFAVIGDPCVDEAKLDEPFVQPFDGRRTTLRRDAPEVRCVGGRLEGATFSDHGHVIISMYFDAPLEDAAHASEHPGRATELAGLIFQDDSEFGGICEDRAAQGYNSGMGEIFRRVAAINPL